MRRLVKVIGVLLLLGFAACDAATQERPKAPARGDDFIDFKLSGLDGKTYDTAELREGKYAIVEMGQTTCPFCHMQGEILKELYKDWKEYPLVILDVFIFEPAGTVKEYVEKNEVPFTVLVDADGRMAGRYQVDAIPAVYIVDPKGKIILSGNLQGKETLDNFLTPLLKEEKERQEKAEK